MFQAMTKTTNLLMVLLSNGSSIFRETFTGSDDTALTGKRADSGQIWAGGVGTFKIVSNHLEPNSAANGDMSLVDIGAADYHLSATLTPFADNAPNRTGVGLAFRASDTNNAYIFVMFAGIGTNNIILYRRQSGSYTIIREMNLAVTNDPYQIDIYAAGSVMRVLIDSQEFVELDSETFNQAATSIGVWYGKNGSPTDSPEWDLITCERISAISSNLWGLTRYGSNPIIALGAGGTWEDVDVANPDVFYDTPNTRWVMNYSGYDGAEWHTGLAYSVDLLSWTKEETNPILSPDVGEGNISANGSIVLKSGTYYLYYHDQSGNIRLATSSDLLTWVRQGVVVAAGDGGSFDESGCYDPTARLLESGTIQLFYTGQDTSALRGVGLATSSDGSSFTKQGELFEMPAFATGEFPGEPYPYGTNATAYSILIDSPEFYGMRWISEMVTYDSGSTWSVIKKVFSYAGSSGQWDSKQVFDACVVETGGTIYFFYAGATGQGNAQNLSAQIGVATMSA